MKYKIDIKKLYKTIVWPLDKKYGLCNVAFKMAIEQGPKVFDSLNIPIELTNVLLNEIKTKIKIEESLIRAEFSLKTYNFNGVNDIINTIQNALKLNTDEKLSIIFEKPNYVIKTSSFNPDESKKLVQTILN